MVTTQQNEPHRVPVRMCIGCRDRHPQPQLTRCALGNEGPVVSRTERGRGAWLCSIDCFDTAVRKRAFARAWKCDVSSSTLEALRIPFESVITNMRDLTAVGTTSDLPVPMKG